MATIILLVLLYFLIILPGYKIWKTMRYAKKQQDAFNDMFRRAAGFAPDADKATDSRSSGKQKGGWSRPARKKKKIGNDVGDYVKFTEIPVGESASSVSGSSKDFDTEPRTFTTEQQVTDVSWEDLPDK